MLFASMASASVKCPFDGGTAIWTGRTQIVNAVIWYVMKCPRGHLTLSRKP